MNAPIPKFGLIKYDHTDGVVTLQWAKSTSRVGYIRVHKDEKEMPGPTEYTMAVEVYEDGTYEFKLFESSKDGRMPKKEEMDRFKSYMTSLGYKHGGWRKYKMNKSFKTTKF